MQTRPSITLLTRAGRTLDYDADVIGADTSLETAAREDCDAAKTDSHEHPSKCKDTLNSAQIGLG